MNPSRSLAILGTGLCLAMASIGALAAQEMTVTVTLKDHQFSPAEIRVPAGQPVVLEVHNLDATAEEFDSSALKVEKVIAGGQQGSIHLRPLDKGKYPFMGEFHSDTAKGVVIAQ